MRDARSLKALVKAASKAPRLYSQDGKKNPTIYAKFFDIKTNWRFFVQEFDPNTNECFGFVVGFYPELGYFSLDELCKTSTVEVDFYFKPTGLIEIKKEYCKGGQA